jgi:8-oxo-dGTP diphosphatase
LSEDNPPLILAAGGVVFRKLSGADEVLLVHRPRYDDWSLPKGKYNPDEGAPEAALREVLEETGQEATITRALGPTEYLVNESPKRVEWFAMRSEGNGRFAPNPEVDETRWMKLAEARSFLTYDRDREVLGRYEATVPGTVYLLRHVAAGNRSAWKGDDRLRPASPKGKKQAAAIVAAMEGKPLERIISSPYVRCVMSVEQLAEQRGLEVEISEALAEGEDQAPLHLVEGLIGVNALLCSHGDVIPYIIGILEGRGLRIPPHHDYRKSSTFVLEREGAFFSTATYIPPPQV